MAKSSITRTCKCGWSGIKRLWRGFKRNAPAFSVVVMTAALIPTFMIAKQNADNFKQTARTIKQNAVTIEQNAAQIKTSQERIDNLDPLPPEGPFNIITPTDKDLVLTKYCTKFSGTATSSPRWTLWSAAATDDIDSNPREFWSLVPVQFERQGNGATDAPWSVNLNIGQLKPDPNVIIRVEFFYLHDDLSNLILQTPLAPDSKITWHRLNHLPVGRIPLATIRVRDDKNRDSNACGIAS